jgi:uncharacterized membrane protein
MKRILSALTAAALILASCDMLTNEDLNRPQDRYDISVSVNGDAVSGTHTFPGFNTGYTAVTPLEVTVTNTGTAATGALAAALVGGEKFTLSGAFIGSIPVGDSRTFRVRPFPGLPAGDYTDVVTVSGGNGITASFGVSFTVSPEGTDPDPVYGIELSVTGTHTFPGANPGYPAQTPLTVTVINTGNQAAGPLTAALSGTGAGSFTLNRTSIGSIGTSGSDTFTVGPNTGLAAGTYTAAVTVEGDNGITARFTVSFTVSPAGTEPNPVYGIELNVTGTHTFPGANPGYPAQTPLTVTVTNTGNRDTGALTVALSEIVAGSFALSGSPVANIPAGGSDTFTLAPNTGFPAGIYPATVTVLGDNGIAPRSFDLSFMVYPEGNEPPPLYRIELNVTGTHTFDPAAPGYEAIPPLTVTVTNTGNRDTGALTVALSETVAGSFTLSTTAIGNIGTGGSDTFTLGPNPGLGEGTYTATVTVLGDNGITPRSFDLSFTVYPEGTDPDPAYRIELNVTGTHTFPGANPGYGAQTPLTVTVTNTGNQAAGALAVALSGTGAGSFTLSTTAIGNIGTSGSDTFTVGPYTGLGEGTYEAAVTVSGDNGITAGFTVSFTVYPAGIEPPPVYGIELYPMNLSGSGEFDPVKVGYSHAPTLLVIAENIGANATGPLAITLSGLDADSFYLSATAIGNIEIGGFYTFIVTAMRYLPAKTYTAAVTVSGDNGSGIAPRSFDLSFTVSAIPVCGIELYPINEAASPEFDPVEEGYMTEPAQSVSIYNIGTSATGPLAITLSETVEGSFTLSTTAIENIGIGGYDSFTVRARTGLPAGTYEATVTVSGDNGINEHLSLSFTVYPEGPPPLPAYSIELSGLNEGGSRRHEFDPVMEGYEPITPLTVTITNTGTKPTSPLTVHFVATEKDSYTLSRNIIGSIPSGSYDTFTIRPVPGLGERIYDATVYINGSNDISTNFHASFTVNSLEGTESFFTVGNTSGSLEDLLDLLMATDGGNHAGDPLPVTAALRLTAKHWTAILIAVSMSGKYVDLDLSACTRSRDYDSNCLRSNGTIDLGEYYAGGMDVIIEYETLIDGMGRIISLKLPEAATSIAGLYYQPDTGRFPALVSIRGDNIETIGQSAFEGCTSLETVDFPVAETIGKWAFLGCTSLETVDFPVAETIGQAAFGGCTALETVDFPVAENIGWGAFSGCTSLETVSLPVAETIGESAFRDCTSLETVSLPAAKTIHEEAFWYCTGLTTLNLPASLTSIKGNPFVGCVNLTTITVNSGNLSFKVENGMLLDIDGTTLIAYPSARGEVTVSGIPSIGRYAFSGCTSLTTLDLPAAQTIGQFAFEGCTSLATLNLPAMETIEQYTFPRLTALTTLNLPAAVTINRGAFQGFTSLTTLDLPAAQTIGQSAFQGCTSLEELNLGLLSIEQYTLSGLTALTTLNLPAAQTIAGTAFQDCTRLTTVRLGPEAPTLGYGMFVTALKTVTVEVPSSVPTTGSGYGPIPATYSGGDTEVTWGNGFRGGGWDGSGFTDSGSINFNITLKFIKYEANE